MSLLDRLRPDPPSRTPARSSARSSATAATAAQQAPATTATMAALHRSGHRGAVLGRGRAARAARLGHLRAGQRHLG